MKNPLKEATALIVDSLKYSEATQWINSPEVTAQCEKWRKEREEGKDD